VALVSTEPNVWRGAIEPLDDRIELYLRVTRTADGSLTAFLRDPLANAGAFVRITAVEQTGNAIRFTLRGGDPIAARLDPDGTLVLRLPRYPAELTFTRRDRLHASGFYPRTPAVASSTYREPLPAADGWAIAPAASEGFDSAALAAVIERIAASETSALTSPYVHSVSVARHGKLVLDEYFAGFGEATLHDTRSAGKSYADALVGAARLAGAHLDERTPLLSLYRYASYAHDDPRKRAITLGNALSFSTGLDCDDEDEKSAGNEDTMQSQTVQPDWYKYLLDTPMVRDPGTKAAYCSGSINLAGGAIIGTTHRWLPQFFAEHLAEPLQMQHYALNLTPTGEMYLGGGAYVRARDFLKLGQLFLDGGTWHGRRVIERDWIAHSWRPRLPLGPGDDYALAWHIRAYKVGAGNYRAYEAQGNGGQILDVIPQLDLAVMLTQGNYNNYTTWGATRDDVVTHVIAALRSR
jgi:CubicO group peptidase (beta-lactamase class C family)